LQIYVYILQCSDGSLYVGHTTNIENRLHTHNSGKGTTYTANRRPVKLVYKEFLPNKNDALKRETQLKKWTREKKQALIEGKIGKLKELSKSSSTLKK